MSLLWSRAMLLKEAAWWNGEEEYEYESDPDYPLRDPYETMKQRGQRYKQQVVENHGVHPDIAQKAIQHVVKHLQSDTVYADPTEYGFASSRAVHLAFPAHVEHRLIDPNTWKDKKPEEVDLTEPIHASQEFIRPQSVSHNLFHPGQRQPAHEDRAVGDPDYNPADYSDGEEEPEDSSGHDYSRAYFLRRTNGEMHVVDGHHRVGTNLLLGKKSMTGVVLNESEIPKRRRR